jgi:hypothetical protein
MDTLGAARVYFGANWIKFYHFSPLTKCGMVVEVENRAHRTDCLYYLARNQGRARPSLIEEEITVESVL